MEHSVATPQVLRRLIVIQVIVAVVATAVTIAAGRQIIALIQARSDLSRHVSELRQQIARQETTIKTLRSERMRAEKERAVVVQQLKRSRYAADHVRLGIN